MAKTRIFVSFDYETDYQLKETLIGQANQQGSPFSVADFSLQERQPESDWLSKDQSAIARCDVFVTILGQNTHNAPGVLKEINVAKGLNKRRFQLRPQGKRWQPMSGGWQVGRLDLGESAKGTGEKMSRWQSAKGSAL